MAVLDGAVAAICVWVSLHPLLPRPARCLRAVLGMTTDSLARFERLSREAHQREADRAAQERLAEQRQWERRCAHLPAAMANWLNTGSTLGEAIDLLTGPGWACACSGPLWWPAPPGTPCGCSMVVDRAKRLQQAAGVVANLMLQATENPVPRPQGDPA